MRFTYPAIIHRREDGIYTADFPDLEDCYGEGDSLDECLENAAEACRQWILVELLEFDGDLPPISDADDLALKEGDFIRDIGVIVRLREGWDE